ncbi:TnsA endonuclease N-terminal domain-containing protein [Lederbergia lenta]|nr:TnsA endonuclease N-terminal domain-containing protein [Lederbergia lenta]MCM3112434.1 TnsA endonuclease N-terminal domain-containing protein [Lederbergia lenta]
MTGFSNGITDIREQFPLLPQEETILISEELGIKRPKTQRAKVCPCNSLVPNVTLFFLAVTKLVSEAGKVQREK